MNIEFSESKLKFILPVSLCERRLIDEEERKPEKSSFNASDDTASLVEKAGSDDVVVIGGGILGRTEAARAGFRGGGGKSVKPDGCASSDCDVTCEGAVDDWKSSKSSSSKRLGAGAIGGTTRELGGGAKRGGGPEGFEGPLAITGVCDRDCVGVRRIDNLLAASG